MDSSITRVTDVGARPQATVVKTALAARDHGMRFTHDLLIALTVAVSLVGWGLVTWLWCAR